MTKRSVFFVSDGTGITAETLGNTLLTQFEDQDFRRVTIPFVDTVEKARGVVESVARAATDDGVRPIIFSSLNKTEIIDCIGSANALVLDLFNVFIQPLEAELQTRSTHSVGRSHGMADPVTYHTRIEAVNFALQHDDGASVQHYEKADLILVGASRSGKTPTSVYLAMQYGIRAANYPITPDDLERTGLPALLMPHRLRLFGLTIDPERLQQIRSERRPDSRYASLAQCRDEVRSIESLFLANSLPYLNTTTVSIEEIASRIIQQMGLKRRLF